MQELNYTTQWYMMSFFTKEDGLILSRPVYTPTAEIEEQGTCSVQDVSKSNRLHTEFCVLFLSKSGV